MSDKFREELPPDLTPLEGELRLSLFYYRTQKDVFVYKAALKRHLVHEGRFL